MNYVSIKLIMDELTKHPLLKDISMESVVSYAVSFMGLVSSPDSYIDKTADIKIENYRGLLPCDFCKIIQVRDLNGPCGKKHVFRTSTDSFHMSGHKEKHGGELTYRIQGGCIFTSLEKGVIEIAYKAIHTDEEGYPMIPDNESYKMALQYFIKSKIFEDLFEEGKIRGDVLTHAEQKYAWYVGKAQTDLIRPTIDDMESISSMWNKFLPDATDDHQTGYKYEGSREHIINH